jgi:cytochrome c-type biogenesis protein
MTGAFALIAVSPIGLATAFAAGFASFASPCVVPLVPAYLSFVSGVSHDELGQNARRVTLATAAFVLGFTIIFSALGAGAAIAGHSLLAERRGLEIGGGLFVIAMGLALLGFAQRIFGREWRLHTRARTASLAGAVVTGMAFAIGWTPCIGPTLGAILSVATTSGSAGDGAILLAVYSLGLGVPFLAAGLASTSALAALGVLRRHGALVNRVAGAALIELGVLLLTGQLTQITAQLAS